MRLGSAEFFDNFLPIFQTLLLNTLPIDAILYPNREFNVP